MWFRLCLSITLILHDYFHFWEQLAYLQEEGEEVGGHLLVGLGVEEGEEERWHLQGEREEVGEEEEQ